MFKYVALIVVLFIGAVLTLASLKPDTFQIERSMKMKAMPETIFPLINDLHRWQAWSPWANKDPAMKNPYSGANSGVGAIYEWSGNRDVGQGRMEITDMSPLSRIELKLDLIEPFATQNIVELRLEFDGDFTETTWLMHGPMPFVSKIFSVFSSMDSLVGKDFEADLANLKALAEK